MGVTNYIWDDDAVIAETDDQGTVTASYTRQPDEFGSLISQTRGNQTHYSHYDALGSTTELTDSEGTVTDTFRYSAFGKEVQRSGTTETPHTWVSRSGHQNDGLARFYVRRRHYLADVGQWLSADPLGVLLSDNENLYAYVFNNPVQFTDPTGLFCVDDCKCTSLQATIRRAITDPKKLLVAAKAEGGTGFDLRLRGALIPVITKIAGTGDASLCKIKRKVFERTWDTTRGKKAWTVYDKAFRPDGPQLFSGPNQVGNTWNATDLDAPGLILMPQFFPGEKVAFFMFYVIDSDGKKRCPISYHAIHVRIRKDGSVSASGTPVMGPLDHPAAD